MSKVRIRTRCGEFLAELDGSDLSNAIWLSLPRKLQVNMIGGQLYFEFPVDFIGTRPPTTDVQLGDIAYWLGPKAICMFFGPTPFSGDDGRPVSKYPVVKIGKLIGDFSNMEDVGDRQDIILEKVLE